MKNKFKVILGIMVMLSVFLVACTPTENSDGSKVEALNAQIAKLTEQNEELNEQLKNSSNSSQNQNVLFFALDVMELIKDKDMAELSNHVHPTKGLRFTPYFNVNLQTDKVFNPQQVSGLTQNNTVFNWGVFDGTGDPIDLNFNDYYDKFVYNHDFINPHMIGNNTPIGTGNIIDNVSNEYPDGTFVEYHFTGFDSQYEGMDWSSLRLVFEQDGGQWYIVGIVHGQWTI